MSYTIIIVIQLLLQWEWCYCYTIILRVFLFSGVIWNFLSFVEAYGLPAVFTFTQARLKAKRLVRLEARLWNVGYQENCTEEEGRNEGEQSENWYKADEERTLSLHFLTLCPPLYFSLHLSPFSSPCDWSELPVWPGFWSQQITSHFVSHNSQLLELAGRLCMQPVHKPAAEGISKPCFEANETQNNSTSWFLGENGLRISGDTHTLMFPPFCHVGTHHSSSNGGEAEIRSISEWSFFCRQSITRYCCYPYLELPCLLRMERIYKSK